MPRRQIREKNILFLSMDYSCSSQMAEAIARQLAPPETRIFSAALAPREIPPAAVEVMREIQVEIPAGPAKALDAVPMDEIDLVVALGEAGGKWPALPSRTRLEHWPIPDARRIGAGGAPGRAVFRYVRDEIDKKVAALFLDHWRNLTH
ncbi:MAG TPA: arsenate reductase (thioredoxin) [Candidatus Binatia bacterium]